MWKPKFDNLLGRFEHGRTYSDAIKGGKWENYLGENPKDVIELAIKSKWLRRATPEESLAAMYSFAQLRMIAKEHQCKVSGKKYEIAKRIYEKNPTVSGLISNNCAIFICTSEGKKRVLAYKSKTKKEYNLRRIETARMIAKGDFSKAYDIVRNHRVDSPYPFGLGITPEDLNSELDIARVATIMSSWPDYLKNIAEDQRKTVAVAAATAAIWGVRDGIWLDTSINDEKLGIKKDIAIQMLKSHAKYLKEIADAKEIFGKSCELVVTNYSQGDICNACSAVRGKRFELNQVPEIPLPECTCSIGCLLQVNLWME